MKVADVSIVLSHGYGTQDPDHWIQRWGRQMSTAIMVDHPEVHAPKRDDWAGALVLAVETAPRPVVLVGHSLGVIAIAHAAPFFAPGKVRGAFLVAPSDWERPGLVPEHDDHDFAPIPRKPLGFPATVVASRNDPYCDYDRAEAFARDWGAAIMDAGEAGHLNAESGQGPWPEGVMQFAVFLKTLGET